MHIWRPRWSEMEPGWRWDVTWMESRHWYGHLDWVEIGYGWSCLQILWLECRWDVKWMQVRHVISDLDGVETWMRWDKIIGAWMPVRQNLDGGVTHNFKPGWARDVTWMELRCNFLDQERCNTSPGWMGNANIWAWIELKCDLDVGDMWI